VEVEFDEEQKWMRMKHDPIEVAFNAGRSGVRLPIAGNYEVMLASTPKVTRVGSDLSLPAGSVAVMRDLETASARG
jgi:hypothetical protein